MVRQEVGWVSFGLHTPAPQWTKCLHTLQRAFTPENVCYTYWNPDDTLTDVHDVQARARMDIVLANEVQDDWETYGKHRDVCDENGQLNISAAITKLRKAA